MRARPVDIMTVQMTDDEDAEPEPPPKRTVTASGTASQSATNPDGKMFTERQFFHLLVHKRLAAVPYATILRRLQRRLSAALRAPGLRSTGRVRLEIDGFEHAVMGYMLPSLTQTHSTSTTSRWVAETPDALKQVCYFPFHALGHREGKLFKPRKLSEARALCYFTPPMEFNHATRKIEGVEESRLVVHAQIAMLNHANVLWTASPPEKLKKSDEMRAFNKAYTEEEKVAIKARGVAILLELP